MTIELPTLLEMMLDFTMSVLFNAMIAVFSINLILMLKFLHLFNTNMQLIIRIYKLEINKLHKIKGDRLLCHLIDVQ